jgi:predicted CXXCH cytochrome family protein
MRPGLHPWLLAWLLVGLFLLGPCNASVADWLAADLLAPQLRDDSGWAGSDTCLTCHTDHHRSWSRTWHRTMTQQASPATVVGQFDGQVLDYWGVKVRPVRDGDGFFFEYLSESTGKVFRRLPVERTVGSHRYQQYLTRQSEAGAGNFWRVPLLWHIGEQRWVHVNGVFLGSDDQDFDNHLALWNQNCIFCHNTGPVPNARNLNALLDREASGQRVEWRFEPRYRSSVAEMGIACEACHSPGATHASLNRNPVRRYLLHLSDRDDPTIINPSKLDHRRASAVCGQCHGQRVPRVRGGIVNWLRVGPSFRAGETLENHVEPIRADTRPVAGSAEDQFRLRFWPDGTPRLSAYEYQGMTASACFQAGQMSCITCHSAHQGDPAGMIKPENRGDTPCLECHQDLASETSDHSRHEAASDGSRCYNCHMPRMVYGVMTIHRSHQIEIPDPAVAARANRPDACTNCHVDRSVRWAAEQTANLWGGEADRPAELSDMPRLVADLLGGDPVQRAVAAYLAGRIDQGPADRKFLLPFLILTLSDNYPMLRWFARRSLLALDGNKDLTEGLAAWDYIADEELRQPLIDKLWQRWRQIDPQQVARPDGAPLDDGAQPLWPQIEALTALRANKEIDIGE